ncbi:MAG: glycosyltransferase family 2 protein [Brevibacillus sp.]|nr:glycosyltransferase family 2 protein [Brevibacillus sp.]
MAEISVVIPVYNQADALSYTLDGFTEQAGPYRDTPIIVVDDGSDEPIESVVRSYTEQLPLTYKRITRSGRANARNQGAAQVDEGIVVFCDADRIPAPDFLMAHHQAHLHGGDPLVIGQVREIYVSNSAARREEIAAICRTPRLQRVPQYCRLVYQIYDRYGNPQAQIPWISTFSGNMSISKARLAQLGGFDETFREWGFEHFEFGYRAFLQGVPFRYQSEAVNIHLAHRRYGPSYEELIRNSHRLFLEKHPDPVVERFLDFMLGRLSLQELAGCAAVGQEQPLFANEQPLYVRITNF